MTKKELKKREKAEMTIARYQFNYVARPIFFCVTIGLLIAAVLVGMNVTPALWCLLPVLLLAVVLSVWIVAEKKLSTQEEKDELKRWGYLFDKELQFEEETFQTEDPETGISYVLSSKGLRGILPVNVDQVFDEVAENEFFLPWEDVEIAVASDNYARRVRFAFAVIDVSKRSVDGHYIPHDYEVHFLPAEKELIAFLRKFGLEEKLSVEWRYIQAQPQDAFRQVLSFGYMRTMLDENGKRVKRENADNLYRN